MTYDEYLLALDELVTAHKNVKNEIHQLGIITKANETNLGKLKLQAEHFANALEFSRTKAKIVELQTWINTKHSLDECKTQTVSLMTELEANRLKHQKAEGMLKTIDERIKSLKETEKSFGKVLHHDFRRNTRTST